MAKLLGRPSALLLLVLAACTPPPPPLPPPPPPKVEPPTVVTASGGAFDPADHDGDGVPDAYDLCPALPEDGRGPHAWDGCPDEADPAKLATRWGPPPRKAVTVTHDQIKIGEEIRFASGSATIDPTSQPLLESIAQVMRDAPEIEIVEIAGHADDSGQDADNKRLTGQRSAAVMTDFAAKGIARARLRASGYSAYCPLDPGKDDAARAKNRRVEFRILRRNGKDLEPKWGGCEEAAKHGMKPPSLPPLRSRTNAAELSFECSETNPKECKARCDFGEADACITLAAILGGGATGPFPAKATPAPPSAEPPKAPRADPREAFGALTKACDFGRLDACPLAARAMREGLGTAKDPKKALELDAKACAKGGAAACTDLGLAHEQGLGTARDEAKSGEAYRRACELGDGPGCETLGRAYWAGKGVKEDHARALELFIAACEIGGSGCATLRDRIKDDPGALRSRERALVALHVACEQDGDKDACGAIQIVGEKPGEYSPAPVCPAGDFAACNAACSATPAGDGCVAFGVALLYGTGVRRRPAEATAIFDAACREGSAKGCAMSALVHESKGAGARDERLAVDQYETACTQGEASGCVNRGRMEIEGLGTYRDEADAAKVLDAACAKGVGIACAHLGAMARDGVGMPADPARGAASLAKACSAGFRLACPAP